MEFIQTLLAQVNTIVSASSIWLNTTASDTYTNLLNNETFSKFLLTSFDMYVNAQICVTRVYQHMYSHYPIVRETSDIIVYYSRCLTAYIENYKVEPFQQHWVSTHILIKNSHLFKGNRFIHIENYQIMSSDISPDCSYNEKTETGFLYFYNILQSLITSLMHVVDAIVVMKDGNRYIVRSILNKHDQFLHKPSKHVFLSVAYTHPSMEKSIAIEFPEQMYEVGNVVFTPMFVKRCLEYQSCSYEFDDTYILDIIDHDANMLTMNSKQYGVLTESGWDIVNIEKQSKELEDTNRAEPKEPGAEPKEPDAVENKETSE